MTLDEAIEAVNGIIEHAVVSMNEDVLEINIANVSQPVGYTELDALRDAFHTSDIRINYEASRGDYYGGHSDSECKLTIHGAIIAEPKPVPPIPKVSCSFCGKAYHQVQKMIAGPAVYICNECVRLCQQICDESDARIRETVDACKDK